jgi:hypothetical protein
MRLVNERMQLINEQMRLMFIQLDTTQDKIQQAQNATEQG